jgi:hypothetical protein
MGKEKSLIPIDPTGAIGLEKRKKRIDLKWI